MRTSCPVWCCQAEPISSSAFFRLAAAKTIRGGSSAEDACGASPSPAIATNDAAKQRKNVKQFTFGPGYRESAQFSCGSAAQGNPLMLDKACNGKYVPYIKAAEVVAAGLSFPRGVRG